MESRLLSTILHNSSFDCGWGMLSYTDNYSCSKDQETLKWKEENMAQGLFADAFRGWVHLVILESTILQQRNEL
ncbi:hypothetical protein TNCT_500671 [Trichonephila clavata]|uniref:Uncharacterized protein n=1 Tax=Trichonephila clavata TaxID=2740835 RepID=A0A8X6H1S3_TRICU|nr:hypothetical protein TNCT_500671 [Trichonephila clavata]